MTHRPPHTRRTEPARIEPARTGPARIGGAIATHALLAPLALVTLVPIVWLALAAFKTQGDFSPTPGDIASVFIPADEDDPHAFLGRDWDALTLDNFRVLFGGTTPAQPQPINASFVTALRNSLFFASAVSIIATLLSAATGYALARLNFHGRRLLTLAVTAALIVPPALLLAPTYALLHRLGLLDTLAGLILPLVASAFGVFLFRQATIQSVPAELIDAATIDGCGEARGFFAIGLPLLRPMVGAFMIVTYLAAWNNFITPQIVLSSDELFPLSTMIVQLRGTYNQDYGLLMAGTLLSVAPVALLFLLLQRDFVRGLTAGAVKG